MMKKLNIEKYLTTQFIGRNIDYYETITSTNIKAKEIAHTKGEGTIVIAEEQTQGRGRLGRNWTSPKGKGLWFSIILKPNMDPAKISRMTLIGAAAVNEALKELGIESKIKWPNDIVIDGKKVCGMLTEMSCEGDAANYVVVGIGINANLDKHDFDLELQGKATSLKIVSGKEIDRNRLLASVLNHFEKLYIPFKEREDLTETIKISRKESALIGKEVRIIDGNTEKVGKVFDIDDKGQLIVQYEDGKMEEIFSGEVSIRGMDGYI